MRLSSFALSLLLLTAAPSTAFTQERADERFEHPAFTVPLQHGQRQSKGAPREGMVTVRSEHVDQVLYWVEAKGTLRERAEHERSLMLRAGEDGARVSVAKIEEEASAAGPSALVWTAQIDATHFRAIAVDCGTHHILLTSFGNRASAVQTRQATSREGLRCRVTPPQQKPELQKDRGAAAPGSN